MIARLACIVAGSLGAFLLTTAASAKQPSTMPAYGSLRGWCVTSIARLPGNAHLMPDSSTTCWLPQGIPFQCVLSRLSRRPQCHMHCLRGNRAHTVPVPEGHTEFFTWWQRAFLGSQCAHSRMVLLLGQPVGVQVRALHAWRQTPVVRPPCTD
jgi:hypothetical protein